MRTRRHILAVAGVTAALLGIPAAAHASGATSGFNIGNLQKTDSPQPCALIESSSNQRLTAGSRSPVTINASVFNCSSAPHNYVISFHDFYDYPNELASCIGAMAPWLSTVTLKPWETRGFSYSRPLPSCVGSYVIDSDIFTEDMQPVNVANRVATFSVVGR